MTNDPRSPSAPSRLPKVTAVASALLALFVLTTACVAKSTAAPIPSIEKKDGQAHLMVDGAPYLILGGQVHNSDTSNPADLNKAMDVLASWQANTVEVPIYWEAIEPSKGQYDFSSVDMAIQAARKHGMRLVFLWFGTWKNGDSQYVPEWVKQDPKTYARVKGPSGEVTSIISPFSQATMDADTKTFAALMQHIKSVDQNDRTVLMMQVENEPGNINTDRDYSDAANKHFGEAVPTALLGYLDSHRQQLTAPMAQALSHAPKAGTWSQVFGEMAPEAFNAWAISNYVNTVAAAGKKEYALPMYVNVWLIEGVERPGRWPSGGGTVNVLDIWKADAPAIDMVSPDIYYPKFYDAAAQYNRPDNPLYVPEANFNPYFAAFAYTTFGAFNGIGFNPFGIDDVVTKGDVGAAIGMRFQDTYNVLRPLLPLIARSQYTGKLHPVLQGLGNGEDWKQSVRLTERLSANVDFTSPFDPVKGRAAGMIIELAPDDFVVVGTGFDVVFREMQGPLRDAETLSIEEGTFQGDQWVRGRRLNGDERHVSLPQDHSTILRVRIAK
ncbi:glycoside hydrolase family 42 [Dyella solisilvae]|uniref:Glycoside hydrolase family 42 n=1 Tax=Dyella solisilvae TaxID=1920168 RepID=A0A370K8I4_9GAMM|nr:DUF5597 domain-containing protein [Dyella solisilvae]RDI98737.1 glycoside hydrolase family 42 [Dyella solisilvae]